jgi:hypothetical protein
MFLIDLSSIGVHGWMPVRDLDSPRKGGITESQGREESRNLKGTYYIDAKI